MKAVRATLPHPRRVNSCHGSGAKTLESARLAKGLVDELQAKVLLVDDEAHPRLSVSLGAPRFRVTTAPSAGLCVEVGQTPCDSPLPQVRELPGVPKDEPSRSPVLRVVHVVDAVLATLDGGNVSGTLLRTSTNGCGRWYATFEVGHVRGGRGTVTMDLAWHHRCYGGVAEHDGVPLQVVRALNRAFEAGVIEEDDR